MPSSKKSHLTQDVALLFRQLRDKLKQLKRKQAQIDALPSKTTLSHAAPSHEEKERVVVEFSLPSVAKATLVILALLILVKFVVKIQDLFILFFIALFLSAALDSIVDRWEKRKVPRAVSIIGIYVLFFLVIGLMISTLIPLVASQTLQLAKTLSDLVSNVTEGETIKQLPYSDQIQVWLNDFFESVDQKSVVANLQKGLEHLAAQLQNVAQNAWNAIKIVFDGIFNAVLVLILTFFMVVDERGIEKFVVSLFPARHAEYIVAKSEAVKEKVGYWLRGQLKLMLAMAVITFIGLLILGVDYALTLALVAGLMELLPVVGPIIAMVPALLIGLNESLSQTFWIFLFYLIIQQLEGNVLVPLIMNKAVGLSPLTIMVVMLIGYNFLGILGIIISVPLATAISIFVRDYTEKAK